MLRWLSWSECLACRRALRTAGVAHVYAVLSREMLRRVLSGTRRLRVAVWSSNSRPAPQGPRGPQRARAPSRRFLLSWRGTLPGAPPTTRVTRNRHPQILPREQRTPRGAARAAATANARVHGRYDYHSETGFPQPSGPSGRSASSRRQRPRRSSTTEFRSRTIPITLRVSATTRCTASRNSPSSAGSISRSCASARSAASGLFNWCWTSAVSRCSSVRSPPPGFEDEPADGAVTDSPRLGPSSKLMLS